MRCWGEVYVGRYALGGILREVRSGKSSHLFAGFGARTSKPVEIC